MLVGLIVPLAAGLLISFEMEEKELTDELSEFHKKSLNTLVESGEDSMLSFSPEEARKIVSTLLQDSRVVEVEIFSNVYDLYLLRVSKQTPEHQYQTIELVEKVIKDGEEIGFVMLAVDSDWVTPRIKEERNHIVVLFVTMFVGLASHCSRNISKNS